MRGNEFLDKMELVNSEYVEAAEKVPYKKKKRWVKWGSIAACLAMIVVAGTMIFNNSNTSPIFIGGIEREYKNISILCGESAIEWPWEYNGNIKESSICVKCPIVEPDKKLVKAG